MPQERAPVTPIRSSIRQNRKRRRWSEKAPDSRHSDRRSASSSHQTRPSEPKTDSTTSSEVRVYTRTNITTSSMILVSSKIFSDSFSRRSDTSPSDSNSADSCRKRVSSRLMNSRHSITSQISTTTSHHSSSGSTIRCSPRLRISSFHLSHSSSPTTSAIRMVMSTRSMDPSFESIGIRISSVMRKRISS